MSITHDPHTPLSTIRRLLEAEQQLAQADAAIQEHIPVLEQWARAYEATMTMAQTGTTIHHLCKKIWGKNGGAVFLALIHADDSRHREKLARAPWQAANLHSDNSWVRLASVAANKLSAFDQIDGLAQDLHADQLQHVPELRETMRKLDADKQIFKAAMDSEHVRQRITPDDRQSHIILISRLNAELNNAWHGMCRKSPTRMERPEHPTQGRMDEQIAALQIAHQFQSTNNHKQLGLALQQLPFHDPEIADKKYFGTIVKLAQSLKLKDLAQQLQQWAGDNIGARHAEHKQDQQKHRTNLHRRNPQMTPPQR